MNAMTMMPPPITVQAVEQFAGFEKKRSKFVPLMAIVVLHLAGFYAIQSGLLSKVVSAAIPTITTISIIAPPAPPKPPTPSVPRRRTARPAAADRRLHGEHQAGHGQD